MSRKIINTNIRLNLDREDDRRAWDHLQQMDRKQYKSYTLIVVTALNDFFERKEQPPTNADERRATLLTMIQEAVHTEFQRSAAALGVIQLCQGVPQMTVGRPLNPPSQEDNEQQQEFVDAALDFADSF